MSDIKGFTVVLDKDIGEEHAELIMLAIQQMKHVLKVVPVDTVPDDYFVEFRTKTEFAIKLQEFLKQELLDKK